MDTSYGRAHAVSALLKQQCSYDLAIMEFPQNKFFPFIITDDNICVYFP